MTNVAQTLNEAAQRARRLATDQFADGRGISPMVAVYRGNEEVALVGLMDHDRDEILDVARMAAVGFGADLLAVVNDSYHAMQPINPRTGEEWGPGEMQDLVERYDALAHGWVAEALITQCVDRDGNSGIVVQPYKRAPSGRVRWLKAERPILDDDMQGMMPRALRRFMEMASMPADDVPEALRDVADAIISRMIMEQSNSVVMLSAPAGGQRSRNIAEYFDNCPAHVDVAIVPPLFGRN